MEDLKKIQLWFISLTKVKQILLVTAILILLAVANKNKSNSSIDSDNSLTTVEGTKKCLVNYDWTYRNRMKSNLTSAWKFSTDGTFNFSTTAFSGMSAWGNWVIINPGQIKISYTKTSEGVMPSDQVLSLLSCNNLKVGSTVYSKD
jgi:hypothetical protein